jgi:hypothetical protein
MSHFDQVKFFSVGYNIVKIIFQQESNAISNIAELLSTINVDIMQ